MKRRVLLVDFYNIFIRNFQCCPLTNEGGEHFGAVRGSLQSLKSIITKINPTDVWVCSDGPNSALRRKTLLEGYKANRKKEWKPGGCRVYDFLSEEEQTDNWNMQKSRLKEYLEIMPFKWCEIPYIEADDIIAEIANKKANNDIQIVIYSTDSDYHQLINKNVVCFNPITKKLWTEDTFFKKHGFRPDNYIYLKVLQGDTSDNVPGIKGIGAKTFLKMFPQLVETRIESLQDLYDICQHAVDSNSKEHTKSIINKYKLILDNKKMIQINYDIMQLSDAEISQQSRDVIERLWNEEPQAFNKMGLKKMFYDDGQHSFNRQFLDWSNMFLKLVRYGRMEK